MSKRVFEIGARVMTIEGPGKVTDADPPFIHFMSRHANYRVLVDGQEADESFPADQVRLLSPLEELAGAAKPLQGRGEIGNE